MDSGLPEMERLGSENMSEMEKRLLILEQQMLCCSRRNAILAATAVVCCILSVGACVCNVYLYCHILKAKSEMATPVSLDNGLSESGLVMGNFSEYEYYHDDEGLTERLRRKTNNGKDGENKKGRCKCKRQIKKEVAKWKNKESKDFNNKLAGLESSLESTLASIQEIKNELNQLPETEKASEVKGHQNAAHYTSFVTNDYIKRVFNVEQNAPDDNQAKCKTMASWQGSLCRNRTFSSNGAPVTLQVFKEAEWMGNKTEDFLFERREDGSFLVRRSGIYLVYAHAQFRLGGSTIALVHKARDQQYEVKNYVTCVQGFSGDGANYPCAITATVVMAAKEVIWLELVNNDSLLSVRSDLYFGARLLTYLDGGN